MRKINLSNVYLLRLALCSLLSGVIAIGSLPPGPKTLEGFTTEELPWSRAIPSDLKDVEGLMAKL